MAYTKTTWKDAPDTTTPITATRLNKMETGIAEAHTANATNATALAKKIDLPTGTIAEGSVLTWENGKWVAVPPSTGEV